MLNEICSLEVRSHSLKGVLGERAERSSGPGLKNGRGNLLQRKESRMNQKVMHVEKERFHFE